MRPASPRARRGWPFGLVAVGVAFATLLTQPSVDASGDIPGSLTDTVADVAAVTTSTPVLIAPEPAGPMELRTAVLTPEGSDQYWLDPAESSLVVTAPPSVRGSSLRTVSWPVEAAASRDHQVCATWSSADGEIVQPGLALRIRGGEPSMRALTVTNNVWAGGRAGWNVHGWSAGEGAILGQFVLTDVFGSTSESTPPLPWRMCARIQGRILELKAWPLADAATVGWGDPRYGGALVLPEEWVYDGRPGWYVGHLEAGDSTTFTTMGSRSLATSGHGPTLDRAVGASSGTLSAALSRAVSASR